MKNRNINLVLDQFKRTIDVLMTEKHTDVDAAKVVGIVEDAIYDVSMRSEEYNEFIPNAKALAELIVSAYSRGLSDAKKPK